MLSTTKVRKYKEQGNTRINQYIVQELLGTGSFASVKLCTDCNTGIQYAVKQMNKQFLKSKSFGKDKSAYDCVLDELQVLKKLEHPNIIWLHEIINDKSKDDIYIVTVYHSKGSLGDQIKLLNEKF